MKFVLASHNQGKLAEMQRILGQLGVEVVLQSELGLALEPEETGTTFTENARIKAEAVMQASGLPAIADDSGLCVDALNGAPGVYSARYGGEGLDDRGRYMLLLQTMRGQTTRAAHFTCAIACAFPVAISCSHLLDEGGQLLFIFLLGRGVDIAGDALSIDEQQELAAYIFLRPHVCPSGFPLLRA